MSKHLRSQHAQSLLDCRLDLDVGLAVKDAVKHFLRLRTWKSESREGGKSLVIDSVARSG